MVNDAVSIRSAMPGDYDAIVAVMDEWWGRSVSTLLPRLFLDHFYRTSFVAFDGLELSGFLVGLVSPGQRGDAYVHFLGTNPSARGAGLGRKLYATFFDLVAEQGVERVRAVTSPTNHASRAFHQRLGFEVLGPIPDYHGPGQDRIVFSKSVAAAEMDR